MLPDLGTPERILLACIARSPTAPAVAREAARLAGSLGMALRLLHVGEDRVDTREELSRAVGIAPLELIPGQVEEVVAEAARSADLLVLGALVEEGPLGFLVSSVARRVARSSPCSTLLLPTPREEPRPFQRIVANLRSPNHSESQLEWVLGLARAEGADILHLVQESGLPGLHLALDEGAGSGEMDLEVRVARILAEHRLANFLEDHDLSDIPFRTATLAGREGWEVVHHAREHGADLLVVPSPDEPGNLWDRLFPHGTDLILQTLPCALLLYREPQESP